MSKLKRNSSAIARSQDQRIVVADAAHRGSVKPPRLASVKPSRAGNQIFRVGGGAR
jgi:hypothetical protein